MLPEDMRIDQQGHLVWESVDLAELAQAEGTPLYVYNENLIRTQCRRYHGGLKAVYPNSEIIYAGKAFLTKAMCRLIEQEGLSLDVVSGGELYTAMEAGFSPDRIYMHGNNKSYTELEMALTAGVGRIVADSIQELRTINSIARKLRLKASVFLRLRPGVEAHTHEFIMTGQEDSKFGIGISHGEAMDAVKKALDLPYIRLKGVHCHIGSQIMNSEPFQKTAEIMMEFLAAVKQNYGVMLHELDLGGGLPIRYHDEDSPQPINQYLEQLAQSVKKAGVRLNIPLPRLMLEPGRSIVGEAGITLYTVGTYKDIPGIRRYVSVDGGMSDNIRPALYGATYTAVAANKAGKKPADPVSIVGKICESGDLLIKNISLPLIEAGDILAVLSTGAYHYSMASNYNRLPRPGVVFIREGSVHLIVKRETYEDLVRNDVIPAHLADEGKQAANE